MRFIFRLLLSILFIKYIEILSYAGIGIDMKIVKAIIICFFINALGTAQNLEVGIISDKNIFIEREPIHTIFYLVNNGSTPVEIYPFKYYGASKIKITVMDENNKMLKLTCPIIHADGMWSSFKFPPGDTLVTAIEIGGHFGQNKGFYIYGLAISNNYLTPGKYKCLITYSINRTDKIKSEPFEFEVLPADKDGENILKILRPASEDFWNRNYIDQFKKLKSIIKNYPEHPYSLLACSQILGDRAGKFVQPDELKNILRYSINTFPFQITMDQFISYSERYISDKDFIDKQKQNFKIDKNSDKWIRFYKIFRK